MAGTESKSINKDWKEFWKQTELVPSKKEDKQLPFLIEELKENLDINKIETVLEVGVGYGRVAKAILDIFPHVDLYYGIDISDNAIEQSKTLLNDNRHYKYNVGDFDEMKFFMLRYYDLVISVETMSCVPESVDICHWIDKMISLSKKYVVNLDYIKTTHPIFNNGHGYDTCYGINENVGVDRYNEIKVPDNSYERLFIARVK